MNDLLIVRTHRADKASLDAFDRYSSVGNFDVTFCCDEREREVDPGGRAKIGFSDATLAGLGLFPHPHSGWRCGDYFYYVARKNFGQYRYYWMIEPDVWIHTEDLDAFFAQFRDHQSDLLATKFGPRDWKWGWYGTVSQHYKQVYGCVFPISRLSGAAIDFCFNARKTATASMAPEDFRSWPNDEAFVANELVNAGFHCEDLNAPERTVYTLKTFANAALFDDRVLFSSQPDGMIYHPVRDISSWFLGMEAWLTTVGQVRKSGRSGITRHDASKLAGVANSCLKQPTLKDAALLPLMLSREGWSKREWADTLSHIDEASDNRKADVATNKIRKHFGAKPDRPPVASAYLCSARAEAGVPAVSPKPDDDDDTETAKTGDKTGTKTRSAKAGGVKPGSPDDFITHSEEPLRRIPLQYCLPYAFDPQLSHLLLTMHLRPGQFISQPNLTATQRANSRAVVNVKLQKLERLLAGRTESKPGPVFVVSLDTRVQPDLNSLLQSAAGRLVIRPNALAQLIDPAFAEYSDDPIWHTALRCAIQPFSLVELDDVERDDTLVVHIDVRYGSLVAELAKAFPDARFVFLTEEDGETPAESRLSGSLLERRQLRAQRIIGAVRKLTSNIVLEPYSQPSSEKLRELLGLKPTAKAS
jgi:hypothetical protein